MKNRFSIILGLVSIPFLLVLLCGFIILAAGITGWWLWEQEVGSSLIRVAPLAPLTTPGPAGSQPAGVPQEATQANSEEVAPAALPDSPAGGDEAGLPPAAEPNQTASGFTLPPGSANSITYEGVATRLVIPKLNLDAPVVLAPLENSSWKVDHLGEFTVGHLEGTAAPGSNSNIVLAAHITLAEKVYGPFASLGNLAAGDEVYVYYGEKVFKYIIDDYQVVDRTAIEVTYPSQRGEITLITCTNWSNQEGRYLERLVIKGYLAGG